MTPDGRAFVFRSNREGRWSLYVMDASGTNVRRLTSGEFDDFASVSPDGAWVYYVSSDGGLAQALSDSKTEAILSYDWSHDGSRFACSRGSVTKDVVSITNAPN